MTHRQAVTVAHAVTTRRGVRTGRRSIPRRAGRFGSRSAGRRARRSTDRPDRCRRGSPAPRLRPRTETRGLEATHERRRAGSPRAVRRRIRCGRRLAVDRALASSPVGAHTASGGRTGQGRHRPCDGPSPGDRRARGDRRSPVGRRTARAASLPPPSESGRPVRGRRGASRPRATRGSRPRIPRRCAPGRGSRDAAPAAVLRTRRHSPTASSGTVGVWRR